jgi:hypothetical protein
MTTFLDKAHLCDNKKMGFSAQKILFFNFKLCILYNVIIVLLKMKNKKISLLYRVVLVFEPCNVTTLNALQTALPDYLKIKSKALDCQTFKISIYDDHMHFIIFIPPQLSIIDIVNTIKDSFMNYLKSNIKGFSLNLQEEFYVATVSPSEIRTMDTGPLGQSESVDSTGFSKDSEDLENFFKI